MSKLKEKEIEELRELAELARDGSFNELSRFHEEAMPDRILALINDRKHLRQAIRFALERFKPTGPAAIKLREALADTEG